MENKILLLDFSDEYKLPQWSLVQDESFFSSEWLLRKEYIIYRPYEIKEKFFKRNTKLTEKKLKDMGFIKIESKTYDWAINWLFKLLEIPSLVNFFGNYSSKEKRRLFESFIKMSHIEEDIWVIENWLRYHLAIQWCENNHIVYEIKLYDGFPDDLEIERIKKHILKRVSDIKYNSPFDFLNDVD